MPTCTRDQIRVQLLTDRDCSRVAHKIWTQRAAAAAANAKLASDMGDVTKARDLRKQAGTFRHYAEQCLADANTVHTAIGELDKYPVLLATANEVPDQLDKALAVARAINAAAAQQWE